MGFGHFLYPVEQLIAWSCAFNGSVTTIFIFIVCLIKSWRCHISTRHQNKFLDICFCQRDAVSLSFPCNSTSNYFTIDYFFKRTVSDACEHFSWQWKHSEEHRRFQSSQRNTATSANMFGYRKLSSCRRLACISLLAQSAKLMILILLFGLYKVSHADRQPPKKM